MSRNLYVGNLTDSVNEPNLNAFFAPFGTAESAQVIVDRETNRSTGFGLVELDTEAQVRAGIQARIERQLDGRNLAVDEARSPEARPSSSSGRIGGGSRY